MHTTLRIDGANCSACFNDVLDDLRHAAGVRHVDGSISESWIEIDHNHEVGLDVLVNIVRPHARGIEMYANEIQMIPLQPTQAPTPCKHQQRSADGPPTS